MNLTALQTRCGFRYRDTLNRLIQAADWTEYLNDAYADIVAADPLWPFLESQSTTGSVTGGTGTMALPADVWRVTSVYNATDKIPLAPIPGRSEYRHWFPDPSSNLSIPLFYRLRGSTLEVYPWPAVTTEIDLDVSSPPAPLASAGDEPVFPEQYHRLLVLGALSRAYEDDGEENMAASHEARYQRGLQAMRADLLSTRVEGYPEVIDTF